MKIKNKKRMSGPQWLSVFIIVILLFLYLGLNELQDTAPPVSGIMEVHFIDVGQGDAILIKAAETCVLVDGGDRGAQDKLLAYLENQGVHTLDLLVGTHPHSDHIGGLAAVINELSIEKIMIPRAETTTETFRRLLLAIDDKGLKISAPVPGEAFEIGPMRFAVVAPNGDSYKDLNNTSIVLRVSYGGVSFMLTGDAEDISENEILQEGYDIRAQVLKVGHHGSNSSTGQEFLDAVNPYVAVISCKKDNDYGHPHSEVMERLESRNVETLRTDELGDIVLTTDGSTVYIQ